MLSSDTTLIGMIDMVIQDIREKAATRVNFVPPGPSVRPSPEQRGESPFLPGALPTTAHARESPASNLLFLPLPITTPLYPNARFFLAAEKDGNRGSGPENQNEDIHLVIGIDTENLGPLWFNVAAGGESLLIKCFSGQEEVSRHIRDSLPDLKAALGDLSFARIDLFSLTDPVLEHPRRPGTPDTDGGSLIDVEV